MDHHEAESFDVAGRYLAGTLNAEQAAAFEVHLLECAACFERVRWEEKLRQGFRSAGAAEVAREVVVRRWWRAARPRLAPWLSLALLLLAIWWGQQSVPPPLPAARSGVTILALAAIRDGVAPRPEVHLWPNADLLVLQVELAYVEAAGYRARLESDDGRELWRQPAVPDDAGLVQVDAPARHLADGGYRLVVEALAGERTTPVANLPFRVRRIDGG